MDSRLHGNDKKDGLNGNEDSLDDNEDAVTK